MAPLSQIDNKNLLTKVEMSTFVRRFFLPTLKKVAKIATFQIFNNNVKKTFKKLLKCILKYIENYFPNVIFR